MKNGDISQSYVPWGSICEYVSNFDRYVCVLYKDKEYLINRDLLIEIDTK
tara:strand:+ start:832 stop:981 length:150 start_codon:yes stop_codon:yes gene_type:complete